MSSQTKVGSLIESFTNILIGYTIAILSQIVIFPLFNIHVPLKTNLGIGLWFTAISLIRSYTIRRFFNKKQKTSAINAWAAENPYKPTDTQQ